MQTYAGKYANICSYMHYMQKYAIQNIYKNIHLKNMQKYAENMQQYALFPRAMILWTNMHKHAKYAKICKIRRHKMYMQNMLKSALPSVHFAGDESADITTDSPEGSRVWIRTEQSSVENGTAFVWFYEVIPAAIEPDRTAFNRAVIEPGNIRYPTRNPKYMY